MRTEKGSISVEYILMVMAIAAGVILGISFLGINLNSLFERVNNILPF